MLGLVEIVQARLPKKGSGDEACLYPEIRAKETLWSLSWTAPAAPDPDIEGIVAIALVKAKGVDMGRGVTFIQEFSRNAYQY